MKAAAAFVLLVGVGVLAGQAPGQVPVPSVPGVTVPVPAVPLPTIPKLPPPAPPATVKASAPSTVQVPSLGGAVLGGGSSSSSSSGSSSSSSRSSDSRSSRLRVKHFNSSRTWIGTSGPKRRRTTTLIFVLPRAARVVFTVTQVSPVCQAAGRFTVAGHAGLNRVRFAGRVGRRQLEPGTYRISARTRGGRLVQRVTLVIVDGGAPTRAELMAARASNVCAATRGVASAGGATGASTTLEPEHVQRSFTPKEQPSASGPLDGARPSAHPPGGVLAVSIEKTARAIRPFLVALLALAILLLGVASLPRVAVPDPRVNDVLARHRVEIAGVGVAALAAAAVAFLLG